MASWDLKAWTEKRLYVQKSHTKSDYKQLDLKIYLKLRIHLDEFNR